MYVSNRIEKKSFTLNFEIGTQNQFILDSLLNPILDTKIRVVVNN